MYEYPWIMADEYQAWLNDGCSERTIREQVSRATHVPHLFTREEALVLLELKNKYVLAIRGLSGGLRYSDREAWTQLRKGVRLHSEWHDIEVFDEKSKRWYKYHIERRADGTCEWVRVYSKGGRCWWSSAHESKTRGTTLEGMLIHIEGGR